MSPLPLEPGEESNTKAVEEDLPGNPDELYGVDISPDQDGGVRKKIVKEGEGENKPIAGYKASVNYTGRFLDGTEFDASRKVGGPFEFVLGHVRILKYLVLLCSFLGDPNFSQIGTPVKIIEESKEYQTIMKFAGLQPLGSVIKGWEIGVLTMKKGEVCIITCQPDYAYGKAGSTKIPPNTPLQFEIELINWRGEDVSSDGNVMKAVLKKGIGHDRPNVGATVDVHLKGLYEGRVFEERDVSFCLGEGLEVGIVHGLEKAIGKMNKEEKSMITIKPGKHGFGPEGNPELGIPPGATIEYEVEIKDFVKFKEIFEMTNEEKIEAAEQVKQKGTSYFKKGKYKVAIKQYNKVVMCLEGFFKDEEKAQRDPLALAGHLNLAACHLKLGHFSKCIHECNKALELDKENAKAFFRRGKARIGTSDYDLAKKDFHTVLKLDPKNRDAIEQINVVNKKLRVFNEQQRKIFANMFDKFAKQDNERETASRPVVDVFQRAEDEAPGDEKMDEKDSTGTGDNKDGSESEKAPPDSTRSEDSSLAETTSVESVTSVEESV